MKIIQPKVDYLNLIFLWGILFTIFGGSYKTPIGNVSTAYISFIFGGWILLGCLVKRQFDSIMELLILTKIYHHYLYVMIFLFITSLINYVYFDIGDELFISLQFKYVMQAVISFYFFAITADYVVTRLSKVQIFYGIMLFLTGVLILCFFQLTNDVFRMRYLDLTATDGYWRVWAQTSSRAIGLKAMSIWDSSVSYALLIFVGFSIHSYTERKISNFWLYIFIYTIFLLVVISGRTGLLLVMFFFGMLTIKYKKYSMLVNVIIMSIAGIIIILAITNSEVITHVVNFAFELIVNIIQGKLETDSTDDLLNNHLFIPNIDNVIFGDNIFIGNGDEFISKIGQSSDSAFVINYVAYGLVGVFATLIFVIINAKIFIDYFDIKSKTYSYYFVLIVCLLLSLGLYVKILVYVSATLLKAMIFVTIILKRVVSVDCTEKRISNEK